MKSQDVTIGVEGPILSGTVYESQIKCGKKNCRCAQDPTQRHKAYQWSGNVEGKNTSRALTQEMYNECKKRIASYKKFKHQFIAEVNKGLEVAPWVKKE